MNEEQRAEQNLDLEVGASEEAAPRPSGLSRRIVVALVVFAVFAGIVAAKSIAPRDAADNSGPASGSLTSVRNNAVADYEAAIKTGKPIYVLFHSLS